jgi:hypothetical protein
MAVGLNRVMALRIVAAGAPTLSAHLLWSAFAKCDVTDVD